jgi:ABC-2 type transport system permease protein
VTALLRAEVLKLRTTRTFIAFAGLAVGTSLLIAGLVSLLTEPTQDSVLTDVFTADTSGLFIIILAVVGVSGEWRHRTITSSLLAAPDRLRFLAAKTLAFAVVGLLLSLAISLSVAALGYTILSVRDLPTPGLGELAGQIGHNASVAMLLGAFGVCVGALVRNQVVAVVGLLLLSFVIEPVLIGLVPEVFRYAPFVALPTAASAVPPEDSGLGSGVDLLAPGLAVLAMTAWIAVTFAVGAVLLRARDLN